MVNANYNFVYVDVECQSRISDGGVFKNCTLCKTIEKWKLNGPQPQCLDGREKEIPYFFLGDEAFALSQHLMKMFPGMYPTDSKEWVFNYRVCRARRMVENVFGISSSVFWVLRKPQLLQPENETLIVMAVAHLHNFLRRNKESFNLYSTLGSMDYEVQGRLKPGSWRNDNNQKRTSLLQLQRIPKRPPRTAMEIRNELADFFIKEGKIPWQNQHAWISSENMSDTVCSSSRIWQKNSSSTYFLCHFFLWTQANMEKSRDPHLFIFILFSPIFLTKSATSILWMHAQYYSRNVTSPVSTEGKVKEIGKRISSELTVLLVSTGLSLSHRNCSRWKAYH